MSPSDTILTGRVLQAESGRFLVGSGDIIVPCVLRGRIKKEALGRKRNVVVGDEVRFMLLGSPDNPESDGVIEELLPRRNLLSRLAAGKSRKEQILMANLDRLFLIVSVKEPAFVPGLLDRFLVAAEHRRLSAWICMNKCDLDEAGRIEAKLAPYRVAGYPVLETSALSGRGLINLIAAMKDRTSLFLGPSGAGKSTLLAAIQPELKLATRSVSRATGKGRHTTTRTQLHPLDFGGFIADSPGVREFGLWGIKMEELAACFPEFRDFLGNCRFPNCSHSHEPDCGILEAVERGDLDAGRHSSYVKMLNDLKSGGILF